ncbi:hypothetical protein AVEN_187438-1 [Araneus ventricosus]|uniref:Gustatory receptor n=1 Tax=Araneus ventricosus TaxID=182803 RepID=A0A4Y2BTE8_ARAVE|nr:hypothetical protein AVEN_187438-1 [Araneus ventricosus]
MMTGILAPFKKKTFCDKLLSFFSYCIIISQGVMVISMIVTESITPVVVGWIILTIATAMCRYFLCQRASGFSIIAQRLSSFKVKKDRHFKIQLTILICSNIFYILLKIAVAMSACIRSSANCIYKSCFFGSEFEDPEINMAIGVLFEVLYVILFSMPANTFVIFFIAICHDIRLIFKAYQEGISSKVPNYQYLLVEYSNFRKIILKIDHEISCLVFLSTFSNMFFLYFTINGSSETVGMLFEEKIALCVSVVFSISMLFLMCRWSEKVSSSAASIAEQAHCLPENAENSPVAHIRYLYLVNQDVHFTVWGLFPLRKSFVFASIGTVITYTVLTKDVFKS